MKPRDRSRPAGGHCVLIRLMASVRREIGRPELQAQRAAGFSAAGTIDEDRPPVAGVRISSGLPVLFVMAGLVALGGVVAALLLALRPREVIYASSSSRELPQLSPPSSGLSDAEIAALKLSLWQSRAQLRDTVHALETALPPLAQGVVPAVLAQTDGIERRSKLSFEEFNRSYASARKPVIITDYMGVMFGGQPPWTRSQIAEPPPRGCGTVRAPLFRFEPGFKGWAGMQEAGQQRIDGWLAAFEAGEPWARELYLHDWSLSGHCPWLLGNVTMAKYFARDLLQQLPENPQAPLGYRDDWPSLFIGAKGSRSGVHIDSLESHFWMLLLEGEKRWAFFDRSQRPLLYEDRATQSFAADAFSPDFAAHPLLRAVRSREAVLRPGELLIVPAGTPHQVRKLNEICWKYASTNLVLEYWKVLGCMP